ncbi:hypothetical protein SLEP1_g44263 [Rubroshorea leprosula]|uniref:Uncharacterized protein n=1 Tax=Rubroshorea leprosula TaxID=152421 RepID=A0AAV5LFN4_9ROSI|nr:hypothetical protein SLEP1_g44263 [Rubroshorea leprosula]
MAPFNLQHSTVVAKASCSQQLRHQNAKEMKKIKSSMRKLQAEMREISEDQKSIREGQKQIRKKFESIESECQKLHEETKLITQQSAISRDRLTLMFQILKARQNNDFPTATALTQALRDHIGMQSQPK